MEFDLVNYLSNDLDQIWKKRGGGAEIGFSTGHVPFFPRSRETKGEIG